MIIRDTNSSMHQLIIPDIISDGSCLINPSILIDNDNILVNLRHIKYTYPFKHESQFGPLVYVDPRNDIPLTTDNYICKLNNDNFIIEEYHKVNTSRFNKISFYKFAGLEDARLIKWQNKFYLCGARIDSKGQSKIEMSEITILESGVEEVARSRINSPGNNHSDYEKNWMPIIDKPFHFIRWTNPTEVVKVDLTNCSCETVLIGNCDKMPAELRGGSQVISWDDGYITIIHETIFDTNEIYPTYRHRFIYWDKEFKNKKHSESFSFMNAKIEFVCGMTEYKNNLLITFGVQDKSAFISSIPKTLVNTMLNKSNKDN